MFNLAKGFVLTYNQAMKMARKLAHLLIQKNKTLSLAESCTGGYLSHCLTNVPGSSAFLKLSIIAYSNEAKEKLLGVPKTVLSKHGAVSLPTIGYMAKGVRTILKTDLGLAISGIAGPTGASIEKPLGLTFIAVSSANATQSFRFVFKGSRLAVKKQATTKALEILASFLHKTT